MTDGYDKIKGSFTEVKTPRDFDVICYFKHSVLVHVGLYIYGHILHTDSKKGSCFEPFFRTFRTFSTAFEFTEFKR